MNRVPPEIDALMWQLAEASHPVAQAEFETRHARYGPELARRIRMVAELRQAGKAVVHRPAFVPRSARVAPMPRSAIGVAVALAVLAVGAVSYVATSVGQPSPVVKAAPQTTVPPVETPPSIVPMPRKAESVPPVVQHEVPKSDKVVEATGPTDIQAKDLPLTSAIALVAREGKLNVTVAPGFSDRKVTFDYGTLTPIETLRTLGKEYGFSVIEEEEGQYLVVPASDGTSDRRIGT